VRLPAVQREGTGNPEENTMTTGNPGSSPSTTFAAAPTARMDAMSELLAQNWWAMALRGVLGVIFGVIAFASPVATILSLVLFFSAYMLVDGVLAIIAAVRAASHHDRWGLLLLEGVVDIAVGVAAFLVPGGAVLAFVLLMAAWAVVTGALMLAAAFRLHAHYGRWILALSGIVSIVYGVLLVAAPMIGAVVLTWWLGAYALVFGVMLIVLAFRLRARRGTPPTSTGTVSPTAP
jgi:uncharacterized membrane protein HdeD (DUF308 family)